MAKDSTKDMTVGSPMKLILGFSIPLLFGALFQQFYSVVDTVIVGRFLGVNALAGVGATGSLNFMIMGFCMGVCSGFAIPVAHKFGAKDYSGMRQVVANSVWLSAAFSLVMTTAVALLCRNILTWMKTPEDIFEYSYAYILIIFLGIPATYLYNILSGIIRSMGDSKTPLFFLTLSSGLNIGLDILFIVAFEMGVAGAAAATVISQLISGLLCLFYMIRKFEILHITRQEWRMNPMHMRQLCGMGLPMGLQYSITAIGSVILQTSVNTLGALAVASVTAAGRVNMFFTCPFEAMGSTIGKPTAGRMWPKSWNVWGRAEESAPSGSGLCPAGFGSCIVRDIGVPVSWRQGTPLWERKSWQMPGFSRPATALLYSAGYGGIFPPDDYRAIRALVPSPFLPRVLRWCRSFGGLVLGSRIWLSRGVLLQSAAWISATAFLVSAYWPM